MSPRYVRREPKRAVVQLPVPVWTAVVVIFFAWISMPFLTSVLSVGEWCWLFFCALSGSHMWNKTEMKHCRWCSREIKQYFPRSLCIIREYFYFSFISYCGSRCRRYLFSESVVKIDQGFTLLNVFTGSHPNVVCEGNALLAIALHFAAVAEISI